MIRTEDISFRVGVFQLRAATLEVHAGEYFVLLGPPGSGKSIFLECLCGLRQVDSGHIWIDGSEITGWEPRQRAIGYVPQDYALFPHLSVERNILFGMQARKEERREAARKVGEVVDIFGIRHLMARRIRGLSGGERQRVALARALVLRPKVLLLDEPVSMLDESTRASVCGELRRVQREFRVATIHVSHDLEEAFSVADRAGILNNGEFQQIGPLCELLRRPASEFVARFMGCENVFTGEAAGIGGDGAWTRIRVGGIELQAARRHAGRVRLVIRPELVRLTRPDEPLGGDPCLVSKLVRAVDRGPYLRVELEGPPPMVAYASPVAFAHLRASPGDDLAAVIPPDSVHVIPVRSGQRSEPS